jgi:hypothetical protein
VGKHRSVTEAGSLRDAVADLYSSDPGEFTDRRKALVARAREGNDKALAKTIAGLRKPTRSAWVVNMLVRADRFAISRMTALGDDLRDAERAVDGARIRELSKRRRELMSGLLQQAFSAANLASPPAALRDEVTSTLTAALADPQVAEQLRAGTLVRAVYRDGFAILEAEDPAAWADASANRSPATKSSPPAGKAGTATETRRPARQGKPPARDGKAEPGDPADQNGQAGRGGRAKPAGRSGQDTRAPGKAAPPDQAGEKESPQEKAARVRADRERAARDRAEQDRRAREQARQDQASRAKRERELRQAALAEARQTAADAGKAATAAVREEEDAAKSVRTLTEELAQARQRHAEARVSARHAQAAQRRAQERLTRLRD